MFVSAMSFWVTKTLIGYHNVGKLHEFLKFCGVRSLPERSGMNFHVATVLYVRAQIITCFFGAFPLAIDFVWSPIQPKMLT